MIRKRKVLHNKYYFNSLTQVTKTKQKISKDYKYEFTCKIIIYKDI